MKKLFNARSREASFDRAAKQSPVRRLMRGIRDHRLVISCAAVAVLGAAVLAAVLSGSAPAGAAPSANKSASLPTEEVTLIPTEGLFTPPPSAGNAEEPTLAAAEASRTPEPSPVTVALRELPIVPVVNEVPDENATREPLPPIVTQAPYEEVVTEVPIVTPGVMRSNNFVLVRYGEHSDLIPAVQERLMILWYMDQDEPTDYLGRVTTAAIEVFQRRNDIPVSGKLNTKTYNALFNINARSYLCTYGDTGSDVEFIQERLFELGYLKSKSGEFDDETLSAVKEFQEYNKLDVDGKVGRNTKEMLYSPDAKPRMLEYGDYGERVLSYQLRLKELGYLTTEPDGMYGTDTRMAVMRFQAQNGLVVDGYLGPSTCAKLESDDVNGNALSYSMHGSDVMNVQTRLYELNYMRAQDVNSYYTSITEQAVRLFQRNNGLDVDGKVGKFTMNKLMSDSAVRASSPVVPQSSSSSNSGSSGSSGNSGNSGSNGSVSARINNFISIARSKLGSRYVRGGKGPTVFDCSGFVYWCMNRAGINQSYMTSYMWRSCTRYPRNNSIYNVKKGDVIVYYGHVAICTETWTHIDASGSNGKVVERSFNSPYWYRNFICSFRVFN
ncbi:MAG: peptidoglycan-binding protein [Clostridia bacterium]|nr:peptidoglycan-binding protein [Clostridia bacterium]